MTMLVSKVETPINYGIYYLGFGVCLLSKGWWMAAVCGGGGWRVAGEQASARAMQLPMETFLGIIFMAWRYGLGRQADSSFGTGATLIAST